MTPRIIYNTQWAKENISLPELLSFFGHQPVSIEKQGAEYWYISPFRYEKEPSFHTSYLGGKWIWNDFGRGDIQGSGTVIGFLQMHENVDVSGALQMLKNLLPHRGRSIHPQELKRMPLFKDISLSNSPKDQLNKPPKLIIREIKETIWDKALIGYLAGERKIDYQLASKYLHHIIYENTQTGKTYNTIGFQNESGDYECRDKFFKGILKSPNAPHPNPVKDISYIPGQNKSKVVVFEGFMDFLSILTIKKQAVLSIDTIILNMVNMRKRAIDFIKQAQYEKVYTFFDNDEAGEKTTQLFLQELGGIVKTQNHLYKDSKDVNQSLSS